MKSQTHKGQASVVEVSPGVFAELSQEVSSGVVGDPVHTSRNDYTVTPVTTGVDVDLINPVVTAISSIEIFDSSGETMSLKVNGIHKLYITPGGNDDVKAFKADPGDTIEIRAVSANATVGENTINFFG